MDDSTTVYARFFPYLDRYVQLEIREDVLVRVSFPASVEEALPQEHPLLDRIADYLTGTVEADFADVAVDLHLSEDHAVILEAVRSIPYGTDASVDDLARELPDVDPTDEVTIDAVREALAANPVPLIIPDHRVRDGPSGAPPRVEQRLRSVELAGV